MGTYAKAILWVSTCSTNGSIYSSVSEYFIIVYVHTVWLIQHEWQPDDKENFLVNESHSIYIDNTKVLGYAIGYYHLYYSRYLE